MFCKFSTYLKRKWNKHKEKLLILVIVQLQTIHLNLILPPLTMRFKHLKIQIRKYLNWNPLFPCFRKPDTYSNFANLPSSIQDILSQWNRYLACSFAFLFSLSLSLSVLLFCLNTFVGDQTLSTALWLLCF